MLDIKTARVFRPLLEPARYKAAYGGRGSGKSHFFAELAIEYCLTHPGARIACVREVQKSLRDSVKRLLEDKIEALKVGQLFNAMNDQIGTPGNGAILFQGMQDHTAESIKSLEGFDIAYVEEAQTLAGRSLEILRPTIRKDGSEIWFSWNPRSKQDPVDALFRSGDPPPNSLIAQANYDANPFFPAALQQERLFDLQNNPDRYAHIWLGDYEPAAIGAYYAREMVAALTEKRIGNVPWQPDHVVHTAWDLGVGDSTAIWFCQRAGQEWHLVDYLENSGVGLDWYARELDRKPYRYGEHILPHDASARELGFGKSRVETLQSLGLSRGLRVMPQRKKDDSINGVRMILGSCWFDARKCERGVECLKNYRPEWNEKLQTHHERPLHDWASHGADAFAELAAADPRDDGGWAKLKPQSTSWVV